MSFSKTSHNVSATVYGGRTGMIPTSGAFKTGDGTKQRSKCSLISGCRGQMNQTLPSKTLAQGISSGFVRPPASGFASLPGVTGSKAYGTDRFNQSSAFNTLTLRSYMAAPTLLPAHTTLNHSMISNQTLMTGLLKNSSSMYSTATGPASHHPMVQNQTLVNLAHPSSTKINASTYASGSSGGPVANRFMANSSASKISNTASSHESSCSSTLTSNIWIVTTIITSTVELDQVMTLAANASIPSPLVISPPTACATTTFWKKPLDHGPGDPDKSTHSSTLLVTKKNPVIIRSPETVGPLFNVPTTTSQPSIAQPAENSQPDKIPSPGQGSNGGGGHDQESGSASGNGQPQAIDNGGYSPAQSASSNALPPSIGKEDQTAGSAELHQEFPEPASSSSNGGQSNVAGNSPGNGQASHRDQSSEESRQTAATSQNTGVSGQDMSEGPRNGDTSTNNGQDSGNVGQAPGGGQIPPAVGHMPGAGASAGETSNQEGQLSSTGGQSTSGSTGNQASEQSGTGSQKNGAGSASLPNDGGAPSSSTSEGGSAPFINGSPEGSVEDGIGNSGNYVPTTATVDGVPILVANSAIAVGSHAINAGSPPTTVVENGQTFSVLPSQIVGPHTTIPIQAAITPPPTSSTTIGGVPVVLQPDNVIIGSQTFKHGSTAAFAVYNSQTYSWDAKQLVGPDGSMVAFPSSTPAIPRITAGGQIFSVYPSFLKASGSDINIPNTPLASPFVIKDQTFSVNPSQLIAPGSSITIPPAAQPTAFIYKSQTFSVDNSQFIAPTATIPITSGSGTVRYGTELITISRTQIICPDTTIAISGSAQGGSPMSLSAIATRGVTFSIGPSAAVVGSSTYSLLSGQIAETNTDLGQPITIDQGGVKFGTIDVPFPTTPPTYSIVAHNGVTFSLAPSNVVLNGKTQEIQPSMIPFVTAVNGQSISVGPQGIGFLSTKIPLPTSFTGYSIVTQGDLTFSIGSSDVVLDSRTQNIQPNMIPITTTVDGQTIKIGPQGVEIPGTIVPMPTSSTSYAVVTEGSLTISVAPSAVVIRGSTFAIGPDTPATMVVNGQTLSVGPDVIRIAGTTVPLPTMTSQEAPARVTADGLTFSVGPSDAFIDGTAYAIGSGAIPKTITVGSERLIVGSKGVVLPSTTIAPEPTPSAVATTDGVTISADATEAIINGTTYAIGSDAIAKTVTLGSETIGLGTKGIVLPSSTIAPWWNSSQTGLPLGATSGLLPSSSRVSAAAENAPPTGLPGTGSAGAKDSVRKGAGSLSRPPDFITWTIILGALILALIGS